jgi:hypothetical protein
MAIWKVKNTPQRWKKPRKGEPDAIDVDIFKLIAEGHSVRCIADALTMADQSVEKRIHWCQANRWATFDRKLMTPAQRVVVIERERTIVGR